MIITDIKLLRIKNEEATLEEAKEIVLKLEEELKNSLIKGVGLAAPQIGINKRVAIIRADENIDLINPIIKDKQYGYINFNEGCLSFPNQFFNTRRYNEILVIDDLHPAGFVATGFIAAILSHEVEHLDGVLIMDVVVGAQKIGRNDLCYCGSGLKYKRCHNK